jgi:hypothetical protein
MGTRLHPIVLMDAKWSAARKLECPHRVVQFVIGAITTAASTPPVLNLGHGGGFAG